MKYLLVLILLVASVATSQTVDHLANCEVALGACLDLSMDQGKQIENYEKKSALDEQIKADQKKQLSSPLRDPIKVGLAATLITVLVLSLTGHVK